MIYAKLLTLAVLVVYVVDLSGFTQSWKAALSRWLGVQVGRVPPFDCSLCLTWWAGIIYAALVGGLSLAVLVYIGFLSLCASIIADLVRCTLELLKAIVAKIWAIVDKLNK